MSQFICPITQVTMTDPVVAMDGFCYERSAIMQWLSTNDTSPNTREKMGKVLITNHAMRSELSAAGHPIKSLNQSTVIDKGNSLRVTLVLDVSGSMDTSVENKNTNEPSFSRLDLIKHAVSSIAAMMRDRDQLSIVTFSDNATIVMPWTKMDAIGKDRAQQIAKNLHTQGGTNIPAGVEAGIAQGGDHTILLTDGANTITPPRGTLGDYIIGKVTNYRGKIHSVGLGMAADLDTPTLRAVSSNKGGLYCFCPDASMVGTVFIHLMANICVNEPGTPFEDHDRFVEAIVLAAATKDIANIVHCFRFDDPVLNEDIVSVDDNKGQVEKAILNWNTWGRHYLPAFIDAHMRCMTTNFKDASLQGYATPNTRAFIDAGEAIFVGITPPIPSCNNRRGEGYTPAQFTNRTMNSQGVCFGPETKIMVFDPLDPFGTLNRSIISLKSIAIKDIKKGMYVRSRKIMVRVLCLVVSPVQDMINLRGTFEEIWVSKKHPMLLGQSKTGWAHAESFVHNHSNVQTKQCYNLVLESGHIIDIGGFEAVTLGHGIKGGIVEHDYLGTNLIINDISKAPGFDQGFVEIKGLKRNNDGFVCGIVV
jgi:hypothetical protein